MTKQRRLSNLSFVLLALVILLCVNWLWQNDNHVDQLEYSQVRQLFLQEKVTGLTIDSGGTLTLELREPVHGSETVRYELYSFQLFYDDFNDLVQQQYAEGIIQHYDYPEPVRTNWLLEQMCIRDRGERNGPPLRQSRGLLRPQGCAPALLFGCAKNGVRRARWKRKGAWRALVQWPFALS